MKSELDSDLLRTFIAVVDTGSFTKAADVVHRTQSAVSIQMKKLEEVTGSAIFVREGRGIQLTGKGEILQRYARRILEMQAKALSVLQQSSCTGSVNLGIPDDYVDPFLTRLLISFNQEFPLAEINVVCRESGDLPELLNNGSIDLAIMSGEFQHKTTVTQVELTREPAVWATSKNHIAHEQDPLPLAMFGVDCIFRRWAKEKLDKKNRNYRMAYTSQSLAGILSFVRAGLGMTVLAESSVPEDLRILGPRDGFARLPMLSLVLVKSPANTDIVVSHMERHIINSFRQFRKKAA